MRSITVGTNSLKIAILAVGSRGDTQPYIALALGLQNRGHEVVFVAGDDFEAFVTSYGLDYRTIGVNMRAFVDERMQQALSSGRNFWRAFREVMREGMAYAHTINAHIAEAVVGSDLIIGNLVGGIFGQTYAEKLQIPFVWGFTIPLPGYTGAYASVAFPQRWKLGQPFNRLSHWLVDEFMWLGLRGPVNGWRKENELEPRGFFQQPWYKLNGTTIPTLYCYSQHILPRPDDWHETQQVTGYWFLDRADKWQPPDEVVTLLETDEPVVYVGFGSMAARNAEQTTRIVLEALKLAHVRSIIASGWSDIPTKEFPDNVLMLDAIPHDWLFPKINVAVHHGGAGTVGASLRAGIPTIIVPFFGDQPFWGDRIRQLGVGPAPIPYRKLTSEKLASAIRDAVSNQDMRERAAKLGEMICQEDGVESAICQLEDWGIL